MRANPIAEQQRETSGASSAPMTHVERMRAAVAQAIDIAPDFLRGNVDVDHMAKTMINAVRNYAEQEQAAGSDKAPQNAEARALQGALAELMGCGSGYLAGRCDAACVARTMTQMVREFATP